MADKIKPKVEYNIEYFEQNQTMDPTRINIPMMQPSTTRPNTLPINEQHTNHQVLFTPSDYNNLALSTPDFNSHLQGITTPDLINALIMTANTDVQASAGTIPPTNGIFPSRVEHTILPTVNQHSHSTSHGVSNTDNRNVETIPINYINQSNPHPSSYNSQASSYISDNESSNSTVASSPSPMTQPSKRARNELQHVPSTAEKSPGDGTDVVKKEKKRERNRQAAQKCRNKKLTHIAELQQRVDELQGKNKELSQIANSLKLEITNLEKRLNEHHSQGCAFMNGSMS